MTLLTIYKLLHLVGLMMGFGGAILADAIIFKRAILTPIQRQTIESVQQLARIVLVGLGVLWVTGVMLVYARADADLAFLLNQKVWAKVVIVAILTINGVAVHNIALNHLKSRLGRQMFDAAAPRAMLGLTLVAAVSSVSWAVPFILGVASEFNFTVPALVILAVYVTMVLGAWGLYYGVARIVSVGKVDFSQIPIEQDITKIVLRHRIEQVKSVPIGRDRPRRAAHAA